MEPGISFEDTSVAFSYKNNQELRKANFIFSLVNHPWVSAVATGMLKFALKLHLPVEGLIRKTAFDHFCGGENIHETEKVIEKLEEFHVGTILDYSVEGEDSEADFDRTAEEVLRTLDEAHEHGNIPFSVFKVTGIASFQLLEKLHRHDALTPAEEQAFQRVITRVDQICRKAYEYKIPVLIDAEETWIQDPIDELAYEMMEKYNREEAVVFNTFQLYRTDTLDHLKHAVREGKEKGYYIGAKLVRGAYMEKERARAGEMGYESPIQPTKEATDKAFNGALIFCMNEIARMGVMCGSHNEESNMLLTKLMKQKQISPADKRIWFAQLYGMSDNISFNLGKAGYNVAKYLPYGPVRSVMPYLLRRAAENTSVAGQSSRELTLIRKELKRRKSAGNRQFAAAPVGRVN